MSDSEKKLSGNEFTAGDKFFGQMIEAGIADDNFIREIVEMFLLEGSQSLIELRRAFDTKNERDFKLFAHKLKSSFLMFDMHDAHTLSVALENVKHNEIDLAKNDLETLEKICEESFKLLRIKYLS